MNTPASKIPPSAAGKIHKPLTCLHLLQKEVTLASTEKAKQHAELSSREVGTQKFTFLIEIQ